MSKRKLPQVTLNPDDAQMLETRRFGVEEICRWFGVPPTLSGPARSLRELARSQQGARR